jgi:hypothetical protein
MAAKKKTRRRNHYWAVVLFKSGSLYAFDFPFAKPLPGWGNMGHLKGLDEIFYTRAATPGEAARKVKSDIRRDWGETVRIRKTRPS